MSYASQIQSLPAPSQTRTTGRKSEQELLQDITRSLAQADDVAGSTLTKLGEQTEQIQRIQEHNSNIESNLDQSEYLLKGLKGFWSNWFGLKPKPRQDNPASQPSAQPSAASAPAAAATGAARVSATTGASRGAERLLADDAVRRGSSSSSGSRFAPQSRLQQQPPQDAREKAYDDIEKLLGGMAEKTKAISRTLDHHNQVLPKVANEVERNHIRMSKQNQEMKKLGG
mmetsp:Transcript_87455/g.192093  ORF Transcript_87455/g.192093 Transcript_87455/m.192093 type:complete len:228 (-) Transcript_87455:83-766(-)